MGDVRAWLAVAVAVLGLAVLIVMSPVVHRSHGRLRFAVGARALSAAETSAARGNAHGLALLLGARAARSAVERPSGTR
jgi:hypothetical protein